MTFWIWFLAQCGMFAAYGLAGPNKRFSLWLALAPTWILLFFIFLVIFFIALFSGVK
jgi:hypothetical protein